MRTRTSSDGKPPRGAELGGERPRGDVASLPRALGIARDGHERDDGAAVGRPRRGSRPPRGRAAAFHAPSTPGRARVRSRRRRSRSGALANASRLPPHSAQRRTGHGPGDPQRSQTGGASRVKDVAHLRAERRPGASQIAHRSGSTRSSSAPSDGRRAPSHDSVPTVCQFVSGSDRGCRDELAEVVLRPLEVGGRLDRREAAARTAARAPRGTARERTRRPRGRAARAGPRRGRRRASARTASSGRSRRRARRCRSGPYSC